MGKKTLTLQMIEWEDATHLNPTQAVWSDLNEAITEADSGPESCVSVGFVVRETPGYVLLAQSKSSDGEQVCGLFKIPKGWIRKRKAFK